MTGPGGPAHVVAPAKLTLSLRVLGLRQDGYHELDAEMVSIDLVDDLFIEPGRDGLLIETEGSFPASLGDGTNLVARALDALGRRARVRLVKRIPIGGGLGGGSADAAAILRWGGCRDLELAARLGADVPFCLVGGRARVGGIGEVVSPLPEEPRTLVLLVPPLAVNTAWVYQAWDRLAEGRRRDPADHPNDLTAAAVLVEPSLARWGECLGQLTGQTPRLAGSGATWFIEGTPEELGIDPQRPIEMEGQVGRLIPVRTIPPGWPGPGGASR